MIKLDSILLCLFIGLLMIVAKILYFKNLLVIIKGIKHNIADLLSYQIEMLVIISAKII